MYYCVPHLFIYLLLVFFLLQKSAKTHKPVFLPSFFISVYSVIVGFYLFFSILQVDLVLLACTVLVICL